jgi:hypothetical protein
MIGFLSQLGGIMFLLMLLHFVADWMTQTEKIAVHKHDDWHVRSVHCTIYTLCFLPILFFMPLYSVAAVMSFLTLWISHFVLDSYVPVWAWARYIRRPDMPVLTWMKTQLGCIIFIVVDQIFHILFLLVPATFIILNSK